MYAPSDLRGLNAMVAAPATPDANRLDSTDTVDVDSLRDLINKLIADGVNVVSMMGSYGECHTLLWEEFQIVSMKDSHRSPLEFIRLNDVVEGKISVFVNQMQAFPFQGLGARGFWSTDVNMGPWPLLRLRDAVDDADDETAKQILREIG